MTITVHCACGTRVRGEPARFKKRAVCPGCGRRLTARPEPKDTRRIPFQCLCGLEMKFPWSRGGLWFDCPECGRKSVLPGRGSSVPRSLPVDLPPERTVSEPRGPRMALLVVLGLLAALAAVALVLI